MAYRILIVDDSPGHESIHAPGHRSVSGFEISASLWRRQMGWRRWSCLRGELSGRDSHRHQHASNGWRRILAATIPKRKTMKTIPLIVILFRLPPASARSA